MSIVGKEQQQPRNEGAIKAGNGEMTGGHYDPGSGTK